MRATKPTPTLTAAQIRAARALLGWTGPKLAEKTGLALQTIRRMEGPIGPGRSYAANVDAVCHAFGEAGVHFLGVDEERGFGLGVCFKLAPHD